VNVVRFSFRGQPQIDDLGAERLIRILSARRNLAAMQVAGKVSAELRKRPSERDVVDSFSLPELEQLVSVLSEGENANRPDLERLLSEAGAALGRIDE
jgi:hypothetical protein